MKKKKIKKGGGVLQKSQQWSKQQRVTAEVMNKALMLSLNLK